MKKILLPALILSIAGLTACDDGIEPVSNEDLSITEHSIYYGTKDTTKAHNAVVSLFVPLGGYSICSGTLITPKHVITAAHCITDLKDFTYYSDITCSNTSYGQSCVNNSKTDSEFNQYLKVAIGNNETAHKKNANQYKISKFTAHPSYDDYFELECKNYTCSDYETYSTVRNDIAILELASEVPADVATPIPVLPPWLGFTEADVKAGKVKHEFVGFGLDETGASGTKLTKTSAISRYCNGSNSTRGCRLGSSLKLPVCTRSDGQCTADQYTYETVDDIMFPRGGLYYLKTSGGTCNGDSGGPALYTVGGKEYVSGLTSYGDLACSVYGVSTAVQDFYDWIVKQAPAVANSYEEICDNGVDDDGNGQTDEADEACTKPVCGDGIISGKETCDGTHSTVPTWTCKVLDSSKYIRGTIACDNNCQLDYSGCVELTDEICDNGLDDDGDNLIDCDDPNCESYLSCQVENCRNGFDDNGNNLIDCDDPQCSDSKYCQDEICDNGIDDDGDNLIDCDDPNCETNAACVEDTDVKPGNSGNNNTDPSTPSENTDSNNGGNSNSEENNNSNNNSDNSNNNSSNDSNNNSSSDSNNNSSNDSSDGNSSQNSNSGSDSCSATPRSGNQGAPFGFAILGLLSALALRRRRNN